MENEQKRELSPEISALAAQCCDRHVDYVQAVLSGKFKTHAAAYRSVYPDSGQEASVSSASEVLSRPNVKALYRALRDEQIMEGVISRSEAIKVLSDMASTSMGDLVTFKTTDAGVDNEGNPIKQATWTFKDSDGMTEAQLRSICELTASRDGLKIKQHDQKAAIKQLSEMMGWNEAKKIEVSGLEVAGDILYKK